MRLNFIQYLHWRPLIGAVLGMLLASEVHAAPLRVTTWSMESKGAAQSNGPARESATNRVREASAVLKKLNPDVIILQQIESWQSCDELVKALLPTNYNLVICSSFRDARTGALSRRQVAILAKTKSYISWSEAWKSDGEKATAAAGGFAFGAVKLGNKNVGIFSVQLGDSALPGVDDPQSTVQRQERELAARQLLRQIAALKNWTANRIDALVVAGDFDTSLDDPQPGDEKTLRLLDDAGLANVFINIPLNQRITFVGKGQRPEATLDYVFTRNADLVERPQISTVAWSEHNPVTCDLDLNAPKPAGTPASAPATVSVPVVAARVESPPVRTFELPAVQPSPAPTPPVILKQAVSLPVIPNYKPWWYAGAVSGGFLLLVFFRRIMRRSRVRSASKTLLEMKVEAGASISMPTDAERIVITHRSAGTAGSNASAPTIVHVEATGSSQTQSQAWQRRAEEAERRAQRATAVMRAGLLPHLSRWLKEKLVRKLISDRARLMETQQAAALKMLAVDERLSRIESQLQQRNQDYEQRIDDLMRELAVAKEENRELIQAKITLVKAEMERERTRESK